MPPSNQDVERARKLCKQIVGMLLIDGEPEVYIIDGEPEVYISTFSIDIASRALSDIRAEGFEAGSNKEWIDVAERLPELESYILIGNSSTGDVGEARYTSEGWCEPVFADTETNQRCAWPSPTHWRPLPSPPLAALERQEGE